MKTSQILVLLRLYIKLSIKILVPVAIIFLNGNIVFMPEIEDASREEVEQALLKLGVRVPEYAEFGQNRMKQYTFTVNMKNEGNKLIDGVLRCKYYEDKSIKYVADDIN